MTNIINTAIKFISERRCSEYELRIYLDKEYIELPDLEKKMTEALIYLKECGVLNDYRLAYHFASHYAHKGNNFITHYLLQRGIRRNDIKEVLNTLPAEEIRAWEELKKKLPQLQNKPKREIKEDLTRFLVGRHFSFKTINAVLVKWATIQVRRPVTNWKELSNGTY